MIWVAFGTGIILGLFGGIFVAGLIRELAISRSEAHRREPMSAESPAFSATLGTQFSSQA